MKKIMFSVIVALMSVMAFAGSPVSLKSGSAKAVNAKGVKVAVAFDYSECMYFDEDTKKTMTEDAFLEMKGADWVADKGKDTPEAEKSFCETFDKASKTAKTATEGADFTIVYHPTLFCYGNPVAGMIAGPFAGRDALGWLEGWFEIKDAEGNVIATLEHERIYGSGFAASWALKREYCYDNVAEELADWLKKAK